MATQSKARKPTGTSTKRTGSKKKALAKKTPTKKRPPAKRKAKQPRPAVRKPKGKTRLAAKKPLAKPTARKGKVLMSAPEAALRGVVRTKFDSPKPTASQIERRRRSIEVVEKLGLRTLATLPVVEDESSIEPRSVDEIADRCLATAVCAMKGECGDQETMREIVNRVGASGLFSPEEQAFMDEEQVSDQARAKFCWRYECMHVFLWALGYLPALKPPHEIADVASEVKPIYQHGRAGLAKHARLRPLDEILDQADLYYRLGWAAVEMRLVGETSDVANGEIIVERHRALNWLIRYQGQDWDDVTTDT
jgi:hypothetical protein